MTRDQAEALLFYWRIGSHALVILAAAVIGLCAGFGGSYLATTI